MVAVAHVSPWSVFSNGSPEDSVETVRPPWARHAMEGGGCAWRAQRLPPPQEEACHWCSATRRTASRTASADGGSERSGDGRCGTGRLLPPCHFGKPRGHIGMLRIELPGLMKGGDRVGKLPRR